MLVGDPGVSAILSLYDGNPSAGSQLTGVIKPSACGFVACGDGIDCDSGLWFTYVANTLGDVTLLYGDYPC